MDRRDFFSEGLAQAVGALSARLGLSSEEAPKDARPRKKIISSLEPMNRLGEPFGARVNCFSVVFNTAHQIFIVIAHFGLFDFVTGTLSEVQRSRLLKYSGGLSVLEMIRNGENQPWRLNAQSSVNRRICPGAEAALYGSQSAKEDSRSYAEKSLAPSGLVALYSTPWQTVLGLGTTSGWLCESTRLRARFLSDFLWANSVPCLVKSKPKRRPVQIYLKDAGNTVWRFTSDQPFEARLMSFNHRILDSGRLDKLIDENWCSLEESVFEVWTEFMKDPSTAQIKPAAAIQDHEREIVKKLSVSHSKDSFESLLLHSSDVVIEARNIGARSALFI